MNLLTINDKVIHKLIKYEILYTKLWAEDSSRTMAGDMAGTLVGIYPHLQLEIGAGTAKEMAEVVAILNHPILSVAYYDVVSKGIVTGDYYVNDVAASLKRQKDMRFNAYQINLIPIRKKEG